MTVLDEEIPTLLDGDKGVEDMPDPDSRAIECRTCGDTFYVPKTQRGRPPVQCPNCKSASKDSSPVGGTSKPKGRPSNIMRLQKNLETQFIGMGSLVTAFQPFDGMVIVHNAPKNAEALCRIAENNPKVRKGLENFVNTTSYGEVAMVLFATLAPILANHGVVPAQFVLAGNVPNDAKPYFKPAQVARAQQQAAQQEEESGPQVPLNMQPMV